MYDVIIIGAGPAGMSAAIYAMRAGLKTLVLEKLPLSGGQVVDTYEVDNYPGLPGTSGFDIAEKFLAHAKKLGADPAVMASPFITTIVDALSLLIYFGIARALLF